MPHPTASVVPFFNSFVSVFFRLGLRRFILVLIVIFLILHGLFPPCSDDYKNKKTIPGLLPFVSSFSISAFYCLCLMIKIIVIRYRIIKITVIITVQLIIQYLRHMLFGRGSGFSISCIFPFLQVLPGNPLALPPGIPRSPDLVLSVGVLWKQLPQELPQRSQAAPL